MFVKLIKWCDQCKPFLLGAQAFLARSAGFSCLERRLLLVTKSVMRWSPRSYSLGRRNSQRCHLLFRIPKSLLFSPNWGSVRSGGGILIPIKQKFLPSVSCFSFVLYISFSDISTIPSACLKRRIYLSYQIEIRMLKQ